MRPQVNNGHDSDGHWTMVSLNKHILGIPTKNARCNETYKREAVLVVHTSLRRRFSGVLEWNRSRSDNDPTAQEWDGVLMRRSGYE